jgi:hypothetical protein
MQLEATTNRHFKTLYVPYGEQARLFAGMESGVFYRPVGARQLFDPLLGGTLTYSDTLGFEAGFMDDGGAVALPTTLSYNDLPVLEIQPQAGMDAMRAFQLIAYQGGSRLTNLALTQPILATLTYPDQPGLDESRLRLVTWNGTAWVEAACGAYQRDPGNNRLTVPICHLSEFALVVQGYPLFLPMVRK